MKQRKRPTPVLGSSNGNESNNSNGQGPDSASAFSSSTAFHTSTSTSSSSTSSTAASSKTTVKSDTTTTTTTTKSKTGSNKADAKAGQKPAAVHSQTMLLELLVTVTRSSLVIVTPLVAGMILRVAPTMMEPIYGSIFIEEGFLEYSLASVIVGVVLAMIYTFLLNKRAASATAIPSTSTAAGNTHLTAEDRLAAEATTAGLRKDAGLRRGIVASLDLCGLVLASAFLTTHVMFKHSGEFGPWRGPHLTQFVLAYPLLALLGFANTLACVLRSYERVHIRTWISCVLIQVGAILGLTLVVFQMAPQGQSCPRVYSSAILVAVISSLHKLLAFIHGEVALPDERLESSRRKPQTASSRASLAVSFIPLVLVLALTAQNVTRNPQCQASVVKAHNPVNGNYTVLARNESITGWISVVDENTSRRNDLHIRVMRAGHSLIGGMYAETGDSIFGSFYIPEAVRLIKNREKGHQETVLQIGLGVGIASGSLIQHGLLVDIVEIDPAVVDYATEYFDWPAPHEKFIQDGRQFIRNAPEGKYDYVIHDVFTGGGVPPSLFSLEALHDIQRIMRPDGVLAMNMVGSEHPIKAQALNSVRRTLHTAFKHVVAFKESPDDDDDYQNIVFFAAQIPIEFDQYEPPPFPTQEEMDFWKKQHQEGGHNGHALRPSDMRDWILSSFQDWPLKTSYDPTKGELILDRNNTLNGMQRLGAEDHWHAMRSLLPLDFWINY
ncbi:hypothetical protein EC957_006575 [Mortierella hygrophila]|uniref:PABS domain-containing protein n=1 Tax=Mortierella hygrophila TaxID=979708 RepID=A0A9P6FHX5_9FUNG|nr:hypothetical protein EC957_006575 [Mortierella hygrophila]